MQVRVHMVLWVCHVHLSPHPPSHPQAWLKPGGQLLLSDYCLGDHQITEPLISFIESEGLQTVGLVTWTEVGGRVSLPPSCPLSNQYTHIACTHMACTCTHTHTHTHTSQCICLLLLKVVSWFTYIFITSLCSLHHCVHYIIVFI